MTKMKVDLSIIKKLIEELESGLEAAEQLKTKDGAKISDYVVEMSKAAGLAAGIMQEGTFLVNDIQTMVRCSQQPQAPKANDLLDNILSSIKGGSGSVN